MFAVQPSALSASPSPHSLPSRVHHVEAARAQFGSVQVERLISALDRVDPLADAVVAAVPHHSHRLLDAALAGQLGPGQVPAPLHEFLAEVREYPAWVAWDRVELGCQLFLRAGFAGGLLLGVRSLPYGYAAPAGNKPLVFSGRLVEQAARRLAETAKFVAAVAEPGGLRARGDGYAITLKVRLMHAQVRQLLAASGRWDAARWSRPINQHDMLGTMLLFSQVFLDGLRLLGLQVTRTEADAYIHLWRVIGWLIGVESTLLPDDEATARSLAEAIYLLQGPPDADSRALVDALLTAPLREAKTPRQQRAAASRVQFSQAMCRHLLGTQLADALAIPHPGPSLAKPLLLHALAGLDRARAHLPGLGRLATRAGQRYWQSVIAVGLAGQPAEFASPERLATPHRR